jgi:hypothetical protein
MLYHLVISLLSGIHRMSCIRYVQRIGHYQQCYTGVVPFMVLMPDSYNILSCQQMPLFCNLANYPVNTKEGGPCQTFPTLC